MKNLKRHGWLILSCAVGVLAAACHGLTLQGARPMPGNGPNGSDVRSSSQIAVGMSPTPATPVVYPITARVNVKDNYHETVVEDPYRWLEDLDSDATRHWVESENQISQAAARVDSAPRLGEGAADGTVELRALRRAGPARRALLFPTQRRQAEPECPVCYPTVWTLPGACCSIRIRCARMQPSLCLNTRPTSRERWSDMRCRMAARIGRPGNSAGCRMVRI